MNAKIRRLKTNWGLGVNLQKGEYGYWFLKIGFWQWVLEIDWRKEPKLP
jgi:hypothetical protein